MENMQSEAIQKLINGRELAMRLSTLIQDSSMDEGLIEEVISSISQALHLLESNGLTLKKKNSVCGKGGSRKRRQASQLSTVISKLTSDEYSWRKYGQKVIHGSKFPRSYFRCTHKYDQGCQATKQVQQYSEDDPSVYTITYLGHHSCRSSTNIIPNLIMPSNSTEPSIISFGSNTSNVTQEIPVPSCSLFSQNQENDEEVLSNLHEQTPGFLSSGGSLDMSFFVDSFDFENDVFAFNQGNIF